MTLELELHKALKVRLPLEGLHMERLLKVELHKAHQEGQHSLQEEVHSLQEGLRMTLVELENSLELLLGHRDHHSLDRPWEEQHKELMKGHSLLQEQEHPLEQKEEKELTKVCLLQQSEAE